MMHRSTTFPRRQSCDWAKAIMHSNQIILCYVGTGWFSLACRRARNWPFWSHSIFLFELVWRSVAGTLYMFLVVYHPRVPCTFARPRSTVSHMLDVD